MTCSRTRLACAALLVVLLQGASALRSVREKQVKLEDIERDNLQSELLKQHRPEAGHPAYHQHQHHQQQQQQQEQEPEQAYHPQQYQQHHHQPPHYRFEQPAAPPQQHHHLPQHQHLQQHLQQQQQHLLYQAPAAPAAAPVVPTHVMYLLMPNGNVAAFQIAPHPNHIQAYYTPSSGKGHLQPQQMSLGTLFHQHASLPMAYLQPQLQSQLQSQLQPQPQVQQQVQYVPAALPSQHGQQRYHPTVHHQPTLSFNSPQAHQLHAQHFRELSAEPSPSAGPEISTYSQAAEQPQQQQQQPLQQPIQQSHKSLFGAGAKATASPPLKGSFSTQTGQSYANFRQYG